ncbi:MAG: hypothetical protein R3B57_06135 [Phycisphaerales bacterium]
MSGMKGLLVACAMSVAAGVAPAQLYLRLAGGFSTNADYFGYESTQGGWVGTYDDFEPAFPPNYATAQFEMIFDVTASADAFQHLVSVFDIEYVNLIVTYMGAFELTTRTLTTDDLELHQIEVADNFMQFVLVFDEGALLIGLEGATSFWPDPTLPQLKEDYIAQPRIQFTTDHGTFIDSLFYSTNMGYRVSESSPPAPPADGCGAVDLAPPYGVLDFSDVLAFLIAFGAGCP